MNIAHSKLVFAICSVGFLESISFPVMKDGTSIYLRILSRICKFDCALTPVTIHMEISHKFCIIVGLEYL